MKLWQKQAIFAENLAALIHEISKQNMMCTIGEVYRTPEQAQWYHDKGIGILNSLHRKKLAVDIQLFSEKGEYLTKYEDYAPFGEFWKSLHPENRYGGDWKTKDSCHFEMLDI